MTIDIDRKNAGNYSKKYVDNKWIDQYKTTKEPYSGSNFFEKLVHEEIKKDRSGSTFFYLKSDQYGIGLTKKKIFFTDISNFERAEVFFLLNQKTPLVLGVITKSQRYYRLSEFKNFPDLTNISKKQSFSYNQLIDNLIKENNKQNNVITYRLDKRKTGVDYDGVSVVREDYPSFEKYKHTPDGTLESKTILIVNGGHKISLDNHSGYSKSGKLEGLDGIKFCEVLVFYFKLSNNQSSKLPSYIELKLNETPSGINECNDSQIKTYHLEKADFVGVSWKQIENPELDKIITYFLDINESGSYNDNSVSVKNESHSSFNVYTQTPYSDYRNGKAYLLFKDNDLKLIHNSYIEEKDRLKFLQLKTYLSITLFYYKARNSVVPEYLELEEKVTIDENSERVTSDGSEESLQSNTTPPKRYLLERADNEGISWKQIDYQDLKNTVTYRIECKNGQKDGYEKSVVVSRGSEQSFEVYSHTPKENLRDKSGLLLFNSKMITLQPNDGLSQTPTVLKKLQGKKYCKVCVYYSNLHSSAPPLYLKLVENLTSDSSRSSENSNSDTACSNDYWLQRIDPNGHHWTQKEKPEDLSSKKPEDLIEEIKANDKNSIMVRLTEKSQYPMSIIKNYRTDGVGEITNPNKNINNNYVSLKNTTYQYYKHDFSKSNELENSNIVGLRIYIDDFEINLCNTQGEKQDLKYNPNYDFSKIFYVYMFQNSNIPLLINYDDKWYTAAKNDYFVKWRQISDLSDSPTNTESKNIKDRLDKIICDFNQINLSTTTGDGYGIKNSNKLGDEQYYKSSDQKFSSKLVAVKIEKPEKLFTRIIHTTVNGKIGKVMIDNQELKVVQGNSEHDILLSESFKQDNLHNKILNSVTSYYLISEDVYNKPLLIKISATTGESTYVFYERVNNTPTSNWKKVSETSSLISDSGISYKVNSIYYNFTGSIKIQIQNKPTESIQNYDFKIVKNNLKSSLSVDTGDTSNIKVTEDQTCLTGSSYKCIKHTIPQLSKNPSPSDVGGLRLFISDKEIVTYSGNSSHKRSIFYNNGHKEVYVYFHTSSEGVGKVPLLVKYNVTYYKPNSRTDYFDKWIEFDYTHGQGHQNLNNLLDQINRSLNEVDISNTTNSRTGRKYGILKPGKDPPKELTDDFYYRISVKCCKNDHYRKITHSTIDGEPISDILYQGKLLTGVDTKTTQFSEVFVYYDSCDKNFKYPIFIEIGTSGKTSTSSLCSRKPTGGLSGEDDSESKNYENGLKIKNQHASIFSNLFLYITLKIEKNSIGYETTVSNWICNKNSSKTQKDDISVDIVGTQDEIKVPKYRCPSHRLSTYFQSKGKELKSTFNQSEDYFPLYLKITMADKDVDLIDNNGTLVTLFYKDDVHENKHDLEVYYLKDENESYEIPYMLKFGNKFFAPKNKEQYFSKWYQIVKEKPFTTSNPQELENELDNIYSFLNQIDLSQTSSYGIQCCNNHPYYYKKGSFNTKRVIVTKYTNTTHTMYVHKTVSKTSIGRITHTNDTYNFNQHTAQLSKQTINEVVVIYNGSSSTDVPLLVLFNEAGKYSTDNSTTHGYYHTQTDRAHNNQYSFQYIQHGCKMINKLLGEPDDFFGSCSEENIRPMGDTWTTITNSKMNQVKGSPTTDVDTTNCQVPVDVEEELEKCPEVKFEDRGYEITFPGTEENDSIHPQDNGLQVYLSASRSIDSGRIPNSTVSTSRGGVQGVSSSEQQSAPQAPAVEDPYEKVTSGKDGEAGAQNPLASQGSGVHDNARSLDGMESGDNSEQGSGGIDSKARSHGPLGSPGENGDSDLDSQTHLDGSSTTQSSMGTSFSQPVAENTASKSVNGTTSRKEGQEIKPDGGGVDSGLSNSGGLAAGSSGERGDNVRQSSSSGSGRSSESEASPEADRGETDPPGRKASSGDKGELGSDGSNRNPSEANNSSAQSSGGGFFDDPLKYIKEHPGIFYGSSGAVAGVGVVGTVGGVVYKKCVVGSAVAAGKAAAKVAAAAASGI